MKIAIDFDGTIVEHCFPKIGPPVPFALHYMKVWKQLGAQLILWTVRGDWMDNGDMLTEAVEYCRQNGVEFDAINKGIGQEWTNSPKAHARVFIDDRGFGCPLIPGKVTKAMVDWKIVGPEVTKMVRNERIG